MFTKLKKCLNILQDNFCIGSQGHNQLIQSKLQGDLLQSEHGSLVITLEIMLKFKKCLEQIIHVQNTMKSHEVLEEYNNLLVHYICQLYSEK